MNGVAQASGWPGVLKLSRDWFPEANLGVVMAWWGTHLVVGGFIATNLAAALTAGGVWRRAAWMPSILLALVGIGFGLLARDKARSPEAGSAVKAPLRGSLPLTRPLLAIAAMYFCVKLTRYSFLFWLPLYMTGAIALRSRAGRLRVVGLRVRGL